MNRNLTLLSVTPTPKPSQDQARRPLLDQGGSEPAPGAAHSRVVVQTDSVAEFLLRDLRFDSPVIRDLITEWNEELGFTPQDGSTVDARDFEAPNGIFLVIAVGDEPVGCGGVRRLTQTTGEVKRLFVREAARGQGAGRTLLAELETRAARLGFQRLWLDTHAGAAAAIGLFRSTDFQPIGNYNDNPYASYWFEKHLQGARR